MCCGKIFKNIKNFFMSFCNGSLYSIEDEDKYYEMKKWKDEKDEKDNYPIIVNTRDEITNKNFFIYEYVQNNIKKEEKEWEILL